jgi:hypothetical protein
MALPFRLSLSLTNFLCDCARRVDGLCVQAVATAPIFLLISLATALVALILCVSSQGGRAVLAVATTQGRWADGFALPSLTNFRCDCARRGDGLTVQAVAIPY